MLLLIDYGLFDLWGYLGQFSIGFYLGSVGLYSNSYIMYFRDGMVSYLQFYVMLFQFVFVIFSFEGGKVCFCDKGILFIFIFVLERCSWYICFSFSKGFCYLLIQGGYCLWCYMYLYCIVNNGIVVIFYVDVQFVFCFIIDNKFVIIKEFCWGIFVL